MTEDQKLLMRYLIDLKAPWYLTILMADMMWAEESILKLFEYIVKNPNAEYLELYDVAHKIASENGTLDYYEEEYEDDTVES